VLAEKLVNKMIESKVLMKEKNMVSMMAEKTAVIEVDKKV